MASYVAEANTAAALESEPGQLNGTTQNPLAAGDYRGSVGGNARKRYRYVDRGDGMYEAARELSGRPHLVLSGKHAGRSNVKYVGHYAGNWALHLWLKDFFTSVANVRLVWLFLVMLAVYTATYFLWGIAWYIINSSSNTCVKGLNETFLSAYMFSLETQATIGFGSRYVGVCASSAIVLTLQNVTGMILDAVSLGIIFAKISHPRHRGRSVFISECATIARRDGQLKFMFRIADVRSNTACEARISVFLFTWGDGRVTYEGEHIPVRVETMEVPSIQGALLLPSVLEHTIDERSPLNGLTHDDLVARNAEIVVIFEAVSDFGDTFMVRRSYLPSEIHWGSFFVPVTQKAGPGSLRHVVDLSRFHDVMPMEGMEQNLPPAEQSRAVLAGGTPQQPRTLPYPALGENTLVASDCAVVMARDKAKCLAVRVGDTRPGQMLEVRVRAYLYEWASRTTKEGEVLPYTMREVDLGHSQGTDRLLLRFPQTVTHALTPESPLARWAQPRTTPPHAAELVVVVEGVAYSGSAAMARTATYKLPDDLKRDHYFAPMVAHGDDDGAAPAIDWAAFHETVPLGQRRELSATGSDLGLGMGSARTRAESAGGGGGDSLGSLQAQEVELGGLGQQQR